MVYGAVGVREGPDEMIEKQTRKQAKQQMISSDKSIKPSKIEPTKRM